MRIRALLGFALIVSGFTLGSLAADEKKAEGHKFPGLDPFAQLAGEWEGREVSGKNTEQDLKAKYKVTSAGSAVVETLFPDSPHEMVTIICPDGDKLVLTHYCALGNQPRMKGKIEANKVAFKFDSATNLKSDNDPHMHEVTYTFVDKDTLKSEWVHYDGGKPTGTAVFEFKRKK
ncbi:MAG TPA: hypothetical protein VGX70_07500 [Gemmataceae bacterium]|jgi:hypothetical protein|nr:hypothetical protein [Gemmataceae bacterium]